MNAAADIVCTLDCGKWLTDLPEAEALCRRAAAAALGAARADHGAAAGRTEDGGEIGAGEISVLLADDDLVRDLNRRYRGIDRATNVLAFAMSEAGPTRGGGPAGAPSLLGDIVIALESTAREAAEQNKPLGDHFSHLVVHGALHLLGYDHAMEEEASRMERLEIAALAGLGVADPYAAGIQPAAAEPASAEP